MRALRARAPCARAPRVAARALSRARVLLLRARAVGGGVCVESPPAAAVSPPLRITPLEAGELEGMIVQLFWARPSGVRFSTLLFCGFREIESGFKTRPNVMFL